MCDFCNGEDKIDTTIGDYGLIIRLDEEHNEIMKVRLEYDTACGHIGLTRPIKIRYCPFCSRKLI